MKTYKHYVGLDVHANSVSVAVASAGNGEARSLGNIPNNVGALRKLLSKEGDITKMKVCYEAGPCGYALYWELVQIGVDCDVVAPSLIPTKASDKVKTDRKDALKLARYLRSGELTPVWVPAPEHEALRNLVRVREACRQDKRRAQQRLEKLLLRQGLSAPISTRASKTSKDKKVKAFGKKHLEWLKTIRFEHEGTQLAFDEYRAEAAHQTSRIERVDALITKAVAAAPDSLREVVLALQSLRGVAQTTAITIATEVGDFSRFAKPPQLMAWAGLVPSEHSSGGPGKSRRFGITKTGNSTVRRLLTECAWHYRYHVTPSSAVDKRRLNASASSIAIAKKAEHRLHDRYKRMDASNKPKNKIVSAIARELVGFVWAIARDIEMKHAAKPAQKKRIYKMKKAA